MRTWTGVHFFTDPDGPTIQIDSGVEGAMELKIRSDGSVDLLVFNVDRASIKISPEDVRELLTWLQVKAPFINPDTGETV